MYYHKEELDNLISRIKEILNGQGERDEKLGEVCKLLEASIVYYDWVGIYFADPGKKELALGPFVGEPTEHTRISFGDGICGQAAVTKKPFIVQDVSKETNYLSCSVKVMSEIVVPIIKNGEVLGELDIDSHTLSPFTDKDVYVLEGACRCIADIL
jgi:L-methionine (R)-S-oxide reductase